MLAALLAPFASGWAMATGVAEGRILVICTGDGLRTIYVDQNGDAQELSGEAVSCVLKSAIDTASPIPPLTAPTDLLFVYGAELTGATPTTTAWHLSPLPRAPPET
jgi:hypothetical protein